jgi:ubiquinone/menaquinone biosynthesis C-methylase UbiE
LENAKREGVAERVKLETGNMMQMPFADASFDVAVSMAAIHNIYDSAGRAKAIAEIARVLKPGGYVLIDDIRHIGEYEAALRANGFAEVRRLDGGFYAFFFMLSTFGSLRPGRISGRKL